MNVIIYDLPARAQAEFDEHIDLGAPIDVAMEAACRVAAAEELRRLAGTPVAFAVALSALRSRADELDPDGAR
jgi:hypothetical protein